jgi:hypothetical protein
VPFLKFSRDKRGYEHTYLMHAVTRRGKPARTRILYWYRTPPGVRVGRLPFDEEVRKTIEGRNPGVVFNWDVLASTPIPPPDNTEHWRERRRLEKAAKQARRQEEADEALEAADAPDGEPSSERAEPSEAGESGDHEALTPPAIAADQDSPQGQQGASSPGGARRRRRRGGRRRGAPDAPGAAAGGTGESMGSEPAPSSAPDSSSEEQ